jgi:hypothetical protein
MAREKSNPRHADYRGVSGMSPQNCGERLDIPRRAYGLRHGGSAPARACRGAEFRYRSDTRLVKDCGQSVPHSQESCRSRFSSSRLPASAW